MKKTVFTILSVLTVCAVIIMSCEKEDKSATKVYYNTQPGYGTGGNPNPNGVATSGGSATTTGTSGTSSTGTSTTGTSCTSSQTSNGVTGSSVGANGGLGMGGTYVVNHNSSVGTVVINFSTTSAPPSGTYAIVSGTPGAGQCSFSDYGIYANGGSVTVTSPATGATNGKLTYTSVVAGTYTITGVACY
jgi:hypothetical protein